MDSETTEIIWVKTPTAGGWHILHSYRYGPAKGWQTAVYAYFLTTCGQKFTGQIKLQKLPVGEFPKGGRKNPYRTNANVCDHCDTIAHSLKTGVDITDQIKEDSFS